jgi:hypothetical protein
MSVGGGGYMKRGREVRQLQKRRIYINYKKVKINEKRGKN